MKMWREAVKKNKAKLFSMVATERTRGVSGNIFYCEDDQALPQIVQRGCGISILGDVQNPSGHRSGQAAQGDSA